MKNETPRVYKRFYWATIPPVKPPVDVNLDPAIALGQFITALVGALILFATIWVLFELIQAGLEWIGSGGDKTSVESARNRITNALIGLLIVFSAWAVYLVILQFLGISPLGTGGNINLRLPTL